MSVSNEGSVVGDDVTSNSRTDWFTGYDVVELTYWVVSSVTLAGVIAGTATSLDSIEMFFTCSWNAWRLPKPWNMQGIQVGLLCSVENYMIYNVMLQYIMHWCRIKIIMLEDYPSPETCKESKSACFVQWRTRWYNATIHHALMQN